MDELKFPSEWYGLHSFHSGRGAQRLQQWGPNRYMVDGNLRQQKIKDIIKTWTEPKMSL